MTNLIAEHDEKICTVMHLSDWFIETENMSNLFILVALYNISRFLKSQYIAIYTMYCSADWGPEAVMLVIKIVLISIELLYMIS